MKTVTLSDLQQRSGAVDVSRLKTGAQGKPFMLRVRDGGLEYVPESTGKARPDTWAQIERVLARFNKGGSLKPADYHDITRNSSYFIATLLHLFPALDRSSDPAAASEAEGVLRQAPAVLPPNAKAHQRIGSVSNSRVGSDFEHVALEYFATEGVQLHRGYPIELGLTVKKVRHFDLGSSQARVLVECKSHRWTEGARVPSAKLTVWNEAMFYFHLAPSDYRKILFVLHDRRDGDGESLLSYYTRMYRHLIPEGVEIMEWDEESGAIVAH